jgi:type IV pilus assembly protein PilE
MKTKFQNGFTLVELMIVVAIVSILAYVASASFSDNVTASKRTEGRAAVLSTAVTLEKCKAIYGTYNNANCSISSGDSITSPDGLYTVAVTSGPTTFSLVASPQGSQSSDTDCTSIRLNHLQQQTGTGAKPAVCW